MVTRALTWNINWANLSRPSVKTRRLLVCFDPHEVKFADCVAIGGFLLWVRRFTLDRRSGEGQMAEEK
jgi:hypothetical protein